MVVIIEVRYVIISKNKIPRIILFLPFYDFPCIICCLAKIIHYNYFAESPTLFYHFKITYLIPPVLSFDAL